MVFPPRHNIDNQDHLAAYAIWDMRSMNSGFCTFRFAFEVVDSTLDISLLHHYACEKGRTGKALFLRTGCISPDDLKEKSENGRSWSLVFRYWRWLYRGLATFESLPLRPRRNIATLHWNSLRMTLPLTWAIDLKQDRLRFYGRESVMVSSCPHFC